MAVNQTFFLRASVGAQPGALNVSQDVMAVQTLLNEHAAVVGFEPLTVNGEVSPTMIEDIRLFQKKIVGLRVADGRVDPNGVTIAQLNRPPVEVLPAYNPTFKDIYSHPNAYQVKLTYGTQGDGTPVVQLNEKAEALLRSIVAGCGMTAATLNSTLRTYHDQARITLTQTIKRKNGETTVSDWYGADVLAACKKYKDDIAGLAKWWQLHDEKRGRVSSKHLSNRAMDVVPAGDRTKFVAKVKSLIPLPGSGVAKIIPKGVLHEPVDHVEFTFPVTG